MIQMPPIPSWDGLHPLIIHFPIALLLVAPLLVLVGAPLKPEKGRPVLYVALALMVAGTLSIFLAASTGEAAGKLAERTPQIDAVLERHEELADATRAVFSGLTRDLRSHHVRADGLPETVWATGLDGAATRISAFLRSRRSSVDEHGTQWRKAGT